MVPAFLSLLATVVAANTCPDDTYHSPNTGKCEPKSMEGDHCNLVQKCMSPLKCVDFICEAASCSHEPPIPGVMPGKDRPKIIIGADINYPPYAQLVVPPNGNYVVGGFAVDFAKGLESVCDIDVVVTEVKWAECWSSNKIGAGLKAGELHGCVSYTHTQGTRPRFLDFSDGIMEHNKPAGLLVRLDGEGNPLVSPQDSLSGLTVVDVVDWAPTKDTLAFVKNECTGEHFLDYNIIEPTEKTEETNDDALRLLLDGTADAVWIYADQADLFKKGCSDDGIKHSWDCDLWNQFGETFAYAHTGMFDYAINGTTFGIFKKGSGMPEIVNPCIDAYMKTEQYYDLCVSYPSLTDGCYKNEFFPEDTSESKHEYWKATSAHSGPCTTGYCTCSD